jgi:hypothetical protein
MWSSYLWSVIYKGSKDPLYMKKEHPMNIIMYNKELTIVFHQINEKNAIKMLKNNLNCAKHLRLKRKLLFKAVKSVSRLVLKPSLVI